MADSTRAPVRAGGAAAETKAEEGTVRLSQEDIDCIMSWDVSDYVFHTPDDIDDLPLSDAVKRRYRATRQQGVATLRQSRHEKREVQQVVRSELQKRGYVEVRAIADRLAAKQQQEEHVISGRTA